MKTKLILALCLLGFFYNSWAQKDVIYLSAGNSIEGKVSIDNNLKVVRINNGNVSYSFSKINSVEKNGKIYTKVTSQEQTFLAEKLVEGNASLFQIEKDRFIVMTKEDNKIIKIESAVTPSNTLGILAVLFKDCNEVRSYLYRNSGVSKRKIVEATQLYNSCEYSDGFEPTQMEIDKANAFQEDSYLFYGGIGASINNASFFNFDDYETFVQPELHLGIIVTPGFLGNLQGNLYFSMEVSAAFSGERDYENASVETQLSKNTYQAILGTAYHFNKSGSFQPFIGIEGGIGGDDYKGTFDGFEVDDYGGNTFAAAKAGVLFNLKNENKIGISAKYVSEYQATLQYRRGSDIQNLIIDSNYWKVGVSYYFN